MAKGFDLWYAVGIHGGEAKPASDCYAFVDIIRTLHTKSLLYRR